MEQDDSSTYDDLLEGDEGYDDSPKEDNEPIFKAFADARIPVSRNEGKIWHARINSAERKREQEGIGRAWQEALKYFFNDQLRHRGEGDPDLPQNDVNARRINDRFSETENVVFANTLAQLPVLYAKNPTVEFTSLDKSDEAKERARLLEKVVQAIFQKKVCPGVHLKPKVRRAVLQALLTNCGVVLVDYQPKSDATDIALQEEGRIKEALANPKITKEEIIELEGQLMAIYEMASADVPAGPIVKVLNSDELLRDPASKESDLSDANWIAYCEYIPTKYIQQMYGEKTESGQYKSIYKPTHILKVGKATEDGDGFDYEELDKDFSAHDFGYSDEHSFRDGQRTKVWRVWDRIKRQTYMYNDKDWSYPIWVWDDPLHLDSFFPVSILEFYTNPLGGECKGEVTYYLDQQDAINKINSDMNRMHLWARKNIGYNKNRVDKADVERILKGDEEVAVGLDLDEGMSINDVIGAIMPPNANFVQLFNKEEKYQAIDRIASTSDVMRGAQFKTNTTNKAIESYESVYNTRQDEKVDAIEEFIGDIAWKIGQLCLQFMSPDEVATLVGMQMAQGWQQLSAQEIATTYSCRVVGGSTSKPTSKAKKQEAIDVGQVLGQFANVTPYTVIVMLKMFEQAFDEVVINQDDWRMLRDSLMQQIANSQVQGQGPQQPGGGPQQQQQPETPNPEELMTQLPPEAQAVVQQAIQQGVPPEQAIQLVMQQLQGA